VESRRRAVAGTKGIAPWEFDVATLHVLQGPDKGRTLQANDEIIVVGRGSQQIPLTDQTVSRRHAELRKSNGVWTLHDLNSANGTYVNGVRVSASQRLKHGDQIRLGSTLLVYAGDDSIEQLTGSRITADLVTLDAGNVDLDAAVVASLPSNDDSVIMAAPDTAYAVRSWKAVRELTEATGTLFSPEQLLPRVMDILFEQVEVDRGVIFVRDGQTGELAAEVLRYQNRKLRADAQSSVVASTTMLNHVVRERKGIVCSDVVGDERFRSGKSVHNLTMRSVICVPIVARETVFGVIHLDSPITRHSYNEHDLRLVTAIAYQTGLALENTRLMQAYVERERLAAAGETVAYLSHSIKNILHNLRSGADIVQKGLDKSDVNVTRQGWRILDRNLDKCYALMLNMLAFNKQREPNLDPTDVNKLCAEVIELVQSAADEARIVILPDFEEHMPPIPLDRDGVHQLILNLLSNAIDAVARGEGVINVRTRFDVLRREASIIVADNGPGVPPEQREKIFEPFHSTKGHAGTGLGLAVAAKIAAEHSGTLRLVCPPEGGAQFEFTLPAADARRPAAGETLGPA
jgi:two-component system, NtrC family, sensor kinase